MRLRYTHLAQSPEELLSIERNTHGQRQREISNNYTWVLSWHEAYTFLSEREGRLLTLAPLYARPLRAQKGQ